MKLFDDVVLKSTGKTGTIVNEGYAKGNHYFIVELDNAADLDDEHVWDGFFTGSESDLELLHEC